MKTERSTVAHELGHAIACYVMDPGWHPTELNLEYDENEKTFGTASMDSIDDPVDRPEKTYSKMNAISDLGGIFGELLYGYKVNLWSSRYDVFDFLGYNPKSKSKLVEELYAWFYLSTPDGGALYDIAMLPTLTMRRGASMTVYDVMENLPQLYRAFCAFKSHINISEFVGIVDEIFDDGVWLIGEEKLKIFTSRIVKDLYLEDL